MVLCECGCGTEVGEGKRFLPGHYSKWLSNKKKQEKLLKVEPLKEEIMTTETTPTKSWVIWRLFKWFFGKKKKPNVEKIPFFYPKPDLQQKTKEPTLEEEKQRFLHFFANLPEWSKHKPGLLTKTLIKFANPKMDIKSVIFVDDNAKVKVSYIPYNEEFGYFSTKTGFYELPLKGKFAVMHVNSFLPLIQAKPRPEEYELSSDYNYKNYNVGIIQGRLEHFDELIEQIKKWQSFHKLELVVMIMAIIFIGYSLYTFQTTNEYLAQQVNNLSRAVHP